MPPLNLRSTRLTVSVESIKISGDEVVHPRIDASQLPIEIVDASPFAVYDQKRGRIEVVSLSMRRSRSFISAVDNSPHLTRVGCRSILYRSNTGYRALVWRRGSIEDIDTSIPQHYILIPLSDDAIAFDAIERKIHLLKEPNVCEELHKCSRTNHAYIRGARAVACSSNDSLHIVAGDAVSGTYLSANVGADDVSIVDAMLGYKSLCAIIELSREPALVYKDCRSNVQLCTGLAQRYRHAGILDFADGVAVLQIDRSIELFDVQECKVLSRLETLPLREPITASLNSVLGSLALSDGAKIAIVLDISLRDPRVIVLRNAGSSVRRLAFYESTLVVCSSAQCEEIKLHNLGTRIKVSRSVIPSVIDCVRVGSSFLCLASDKRIVALEAGPCSFSITPLEDSSIMLSTNCLREPSRVAYLSSSTRVLQRTSSLLLDSETIRVLIEVSPRHNTFSRSLECKPLLQLLHDSILKVEYRSGTDPCISCASAESREIDLRNYVTTAAGDACIDLGRLREDISSLGAKLRGVEVVNLDRAVSKTVNSDRECVPLRDFEALLLDIATATGSEKIVVPLCTTPLYTYSSGSELRISRDGCLASITVPVSCTRLVLASLHLGTASPVELTLSIENSCNVPIPALLPDEDTIVIPPRSRSSISLSVPVKPFSVVTVLLLEPGEIKVLQARVSMRDFLQLAHCVALRVLRSLGGYAARATEETQPSARR